MNTTAHQSSRPAAIQTALVLLLVSIGVSLVRGAVQAKWGSGFTYVKFASEFILLAVPMWFIVRRRNWARWLLAAFAFGGFCVSLPQLIERFNDHSGAWLLAYGSRNLIVLAGLIALFLPSSNQWFRGYPDGKPV